MSGFSDTRYQAPRRPEVRKSRLTGDWFFRCHEHRLFQTAPSWRHAMGLLAAHYGDTGHIVPLLLVMASRVQALDLRATTYVSWTEEQWAEIERAERVLLERMKGEHDG